MAWLGGNSDDKTSFIFKINIALCIILRFYVSHTSPRLIILVISADVEYIFISYLYFYLSLRATEIIVLSSPKAVDNF